MTKEKGACVVLLSGGQDSTTCLFWALQRFHKVYAVGFDYGQRHIAELNCARNICAAEGVSYHIFHLGAIFSDSSLLRTEDSNHNTVHKHNAALPSSFVAGRNALFFTLAASYAYAQRAQRLVSGVCETDYSGYPDCRQAFVVSQQKTLCLALDYEIEILTPLMYLSKAQTWQLARALSTPEKNVLDIIRTQTMTDYNGDATMNEWGMGKLDNPASVLREQGYREAKANGWLE